MSKNVTIRDVAAAAGVSHQTVSRVINNRTDVADETRERVWQIIQELGYRPNAIARSLIQQRSFTLGVVTAGLKYIGPSRTLNGITEKAEEMGYALLLKELPRFDTSDLEPVFEALSSRQVDGIIWATSEVGNNLDWLQSNSPRLAVPMIFITMKPRPGLPIVAVDNHAGGCMATAHLLEQGCRHIGHIAGPLAWWESRQRKAGWEDTLHAAGMVVEDRHWDEGNWSCASGEYAMLRLLKNYPEMDAVFVGNDQMALSVLQIACRQGIRVPDDLAVVGFDGITESAYFWPPLTTVSQDQRELGHTAVRELVRRIDVVRSGMADLEPRTILLQPELIVRASSVSP